MSEDQELSGYVSNSPLYKIFTADEIAPHLLSIAQNETVDRSELSEDVDEFFESIGLYINNELNPYNDLVKLLQKPHIEQLIQNEEAVAILFLHLQKHYLPCLPDRLFKKMTGYSDEVVQDRVDTLTKYNLIRSGMVLEGRSVTADTFELADTTIETLEALLEVSDDQETIEVETLRETLQEVRSDTPSPDDDPIVSLRESQISDYAEEYVLSSANSIFPNNSAEYLEPGTQGTTLNKDSELAKQFSKVDRLLISHIEELNSIVQT